MAGRTAATSASAVSSSNTTTWSTARSAARGFQRGRAGGQRQGERADDGVTGARDVGDLVGAVDGDERGRPVALEQRHAAAAAGDQQVARVETLEQLAPRLVDLALVVGRPA